MKHLSALILISLLACVALGKETKTGMVLSIVDGDTLMAKVGGKKECIRLRRLNAPELDAPGGEEAKAALFAQFQPGSKVRLTIYARDAYGRMVAEVAPLDVAPKVVDKSAWIVYRGKPRSPKWVKQQYKRFRARVVKSDGKYVLIDEAKIRNLNTPFHHSKDLPLLPVGPGVPEPGTELRILPDVCQVIRVLDKTTAVVTPYSTARGTGQPFLFMADTRKWTDGGFFNGQTPVIYDGRRRVGDRLMPVYRAPRAADDRGVPRGAATGGVRSGQLSDRL